jgi:YD repeat-containing protein
MKLYPHRVLIFLALANCASPVKTDESSVRKVVTVTEYLVLNGDFGKLDSLHRQTGIKKYDENGNVLEDMDYWGEEFGGGLIYKYDDQGRKTDAYLLDVHHNVISRYVYEYAKNVVMQFDVSENRPRVKRQTCYYDGSNLTRESTYYDDGKVMSDFYFKYDSAYREVERSGGTSDREHRTTYQSYDSLSNLVERKSVDAQGVILSVEKFTYEKFDSNGDWQIRKSILRGTPHSIAFQKTETRGPD